MPVISLPYHPLPPPVAKPRNVPDIAECSLGVELLLSENHETNALGSKSSGVLSKSKWEWGTSTSQTPRKPQGGWKNSLLWAVDESLGSLKGAGGYCWIVDSQGQILIFPEDSLTTKWNILSHLPCNLQGHVSLNDALHSLAFNPPTLLPNVSSLDHLWAIFL